MYNCCLLDGLLCYYSVFPSFLMCEESYKTNLYEQGVVPIYCVHGDLDHSISSGCCFYDSICGSYHLYRNVTCRQVIGISNIYLFTGHKNK